MSLLSKIMSKMSIGYVIHKILCGKNMTHTSEFLSVFTALCVCVCDTEKLQYHMVSREFFSLLVNMGNLDKIQ